MSYLEGLYVPKRELPALLHMVNLARRERRRNGELADPPAIAGTLRSLDAAVSVIRRTGEVVTLPVQPVEWLTTAEVARTLGYTERHVRGMCERRAIRAEKVGREWRIHPGALDRQAA